MVKIYIRFQTETAQKAFVWGVKCEKMIAVITDFKLRSSICLRWKSL